MIDYDSMINGGQYVPIDMVSAVDQSTETMPSPGVGVTANGAVARKARASTQTIVLVWFVLLVILVMAHVVTLSLQR